MSNNSKIIIIKTNKFLVELNFRCQWLKQITIIVLLNNKIRSKHPCKKKIMSNNKTRLKNIQKI